MLRKSLLILFLAASFQSGAQAKTVYIVTDITGPVHNGFGTGINSTGQVVYYVEAPGGTQSYLYANHQSVGIGAGYVRGINDPGQMVGRAVIDGKTRAALFSTSSPPVSLGTLPRYDQSDATAINNAGQIVGTVSSSTNLSAAHPFLYSGGVMVDLGTFGGSYGHADAINDKGQVVGAVWTGGGSSHAFVATNGIKRDLGTLHGPYSIASAINDAGVVAGYSAVDSHGNPHAFLDDDSGLHDLGTLGGQMSWAYGLNSRGWVVGSALNAPGYTQAFLYDGHRMLDLNTLIPPSTGLRLFQGVAINDSGQILANAWDKSGENHVLLLTPVPLPPALWSGAALLSAIIIHRRRRCAC